MKIRSIFITKYGTVLVSNIKNVLSLKELLNSYGRRATEVSANIFILHTGKYQVYSRLIHYRHVPECEVGTLVRRVLPCSASLS